MPLKLKFEPENLKTSSEDQNLYFQITGDPSYPNKIFCFVDINVLIILIRILFGATQAGQNPNKNHIRKFTAIIIFIFDAKFNTYY
jgi:hypothetical protein